MERLIIKQCPLTGQKRKTSRLTGLLLTAVLVTALPWGSFSQSRNTYGTGHLGGDIDGNKGTFNIHLGNNAGYNTSTGNNNVFVGFNAGSSNTIGRNNIFMGYNAGHGNIDGSSNIFMGVSAGLTNSTGRGNIFIGISAGRFNTTGSENTFAGFDAGRSNTTGGSNIFSGNAAGYSNTTGRHNVFTGVSTGYSNTSGSGNVFMGFQAGRLNTTGDHNVFLGYQAGYNETGSNLLYIDNSNTDTPLIWGDFANDILNFNGNVGIGTAAPKSKIHVVGDMVLGLDENNKKFIMHSRTNDSGDFLHITSDKADGTWDWTNGLTLARGGNVGIGTTFPKTPLAIKGNGGIYEVGITQNQVGGAATMELTTADNSGEQATRLLFRGKGNNANVEFYRGARGSEQLSVFIEGDNGNVGIGTSTTGDYKLAVEGKIGARGVDVTADSWSDFVFEEDYDLKSLPEVKTYIQAHGHLPDVPSEADIVEEGHIDVGEMLQLQMQKIEELTLYTIDQAEQLQLLKAENEAMKDRLHQLEDNGSAKR